MGREVLCESTQTRGKVHKNSHLISKYKSLLLTEPWVLDARHIY